MDSELSQVLLEPMPRFQDPPASSARARLRGLAAASIAAALGCGSAYAAHHDGARLTAPLRGSVRVSGPQALRTCVDRWNQGNMRSWGSALGRVSVRRRRCVVSLVFEVSRNPRTGCSGFAIVPGKPGICVDRSHIYDCVLNGLGAYGCPPHEDLPRRAPMRNENATSDKRGVLTLDVPLAGTHPTPPLAWQRRYPHIDGFIDPWTRSGKAREGLTFSRNGRPGHYRGTCIRGSLQ